MSFSRHQRSVSIGFILATGLLSFQLTSCFKSKQVSPQTTVQAEKSGEIICATAEESASDIPGMSYGPTCSDIKDKYPAMLSSEPAEDLRIICPALRMAHRAGVWAQEIKLQLASGLEANYLLPVSLKVLLGTVLELGCADEGCRPVAVNVSSNQSGKPMSSITDESIVDIARLASTIGTAHDCGYSFALGDTQVNPSRREETLKMFKDRAKDGVKLSFDDVREVKKILCKIDYETSISRGIKPNNKVDEINKTLEFARGDNTEMLLIWGYLGGADNGFIHYQDLEDLFHARLPANKTKYLLNTALNVHLFPLLQGK